MAASQELYYKMTRPDGKDFWTGTIDYAFALKTGEIIQHPTSAFIDPADDSTYLSISATPGDTPGNGLLFGRLFQIEPVGEVRCVPLHQRESPNWRGVLALRVVQELPLAEAFGLDGAAFLRFFAGIAQLPPEAFLELADNYAPLPDGVGIRIRDATHSTGVFAASLAARGFVLGAVGHHAPRGMTDDMKVNAAQACVDTAWGIITRGLIPPEYTALLMRTWRKTFGDDYA